MIFFLYKYAYHSTSDILRKKIDTISNLINSVEDRKKSAENEFFALEKAIKEATEEANVAVQNAEKKAENILRSSEKSMGTIIEQKQKEYKEAMSKIKSSMFLEIKDQIVALIVKDAVEILNSKKINRETHNTAIEKSIEMLRKESENITP
jgi:F0F1-type ATP synthase membrane subunit b/b'